MGMRSYTEQTLGLGGSSERSAAAQFDRMKNAMSKVGLDPFKSIGAIAKSKDYMQMLTESAQIDDSKIPSDMSIYQREDINAINDLMTNVGAEILQEAVQSTDNISPIVVNSFGIQERALISTHLPRAVKQVTAKVDNFKLTERKPFIVDIAGNKAYFIDAFGPEGTIIDNLKETKNLTATVGEMNVNLYTTLSVDPSRIFGYDSAITGFTITDPSVTGGATTITAANISYAQYSVTTPDVETGNISVQITYIDAAAVSHTAFITGQFDFANGILVFVSSTDPNVTAVLFTLVLSPETHDTALSVGYDTKHTPVHIPIGEHFEYSLSEEFKDAADKYYNTDAMALLTDYMGKAVEQVKDCVTLAKFQQLESVAVFKGTFDTNAPTGFTQGKEEYIKRQFHPYVEQVAILLKNQTKIPNCHFRVAGNPMDIRVPAAAGVEYIYKRNEEFLGDIALDYEFSVTSDVHKIFYLSSERVPQGKMYLFLIPNTIENNISTVNHYEYATYVSNKYKGTKSNLPTVMISTRYLTKEYFPVLAVITLLNNTPATA
jgi:hypothetical protein